MRAHNVDEPDLANWSLPEHSANFALTGSNTQRSNIFEGTGKSVMGRTSVTEGFDVFGKTALCPYFHGLGNSIVSVDILNRWANGGANSFDAILYNMVGTKSLPYALPGLSRESAISTVFTLNSRFACELDEDE